LRNIKCKEFPSSCSKTIPSGKKDGRTEMTKFSQRFF